MFGLITSLIFRLDIQLFSFLSLPRLAHLYRLYTKHQAFCFIFAVHKLQEFMIIVIELLSDAL